MTHAQVNVDLYSRQVVGTSAQTDDTQSFELIYVT